MVTVTLGIFVFNLLYNISFTRLCPGDYVLVCDATYTKRLFIFCIQSLRDRREDKTVSLHCPTL